MYVNKFNISAQLIKYRLDNNLTQSQLAKILGIKVQKIIELEKMPENPNIKLLDKISKFLGINFE
jgi:DNA-binding XRE family transcriptional regulator